MIVSVIGYIGFLLHLFPNIYQKHLSIIYHHCTIAYSCITTDWKEWRHLQPTFQATWGTVSSPTGPVHFTGSQTCRRGIVCSPSVNEFCLAGFRPRAFLRWLPPSGTSCHSRWDLPPISWASGRALKPGSVDWSGAPMGCPMLEIVIGLGRRSHLEFSGFLFSLSSCNI